MLFLNFVLVQQPEASDFKPGQPPPGHDQTDEGIAIQNSGSRTEQVEEGTTAGRKWSSIWK